MRYALLIITDRPELLERTLDSFHPNVNFAETVVVDDCSPQPATVPGAVHLRHDIKQGGAAAIRTGWEFARNCDVDYVFHLEDDWCFPHAVDIEAMAWVLEQNPTMANIVLKRDPSPWDPPAGYTADFTEHTTLSFGRAWLSHDRGFWLNPCLYRRSLIETYEWPEHGTESDFTAKLTADGWHFGILGRHQDSPRAIHIGTHRSPQWTW